MSKSKIAHLFSIFFLGINFSFSQVDVVYSDLVWSDEFNTNGAVDPTKWHHQTQLPAGGSWFNGEVQHYTNELANSFVNNGALHIVAIRQPYTSQGFTKQFTSARLNSKFAFTYGRVDVRAKLPIQQGTWPAIWMLGKNVNEDGGFFDANFGTTSWPACGEIDIMEHGITPSRPINYVQSALHTPSSFGNTVNHGGTLAANLGTDFHVYSMNWSPFQITFLLDGVAFYSYNPAVKTPSNWPFNLDQYLLLNIAMGGVAGTINSNFSQDTMEIDYVRVYQQGPLTIANPIKNKDLLLFPNPATDKLNLKIAENQIGNQVTIYSILGQELNSYILNTEETILDVSHYQNGIYLLKINTNSGIQTYKFIKE